MRLLIKDSIWELKNLHPFARNVIRCAYQLTVLLCLFALCIFAAAPHTPDYFRSMEYGAAALSISPAMSAAGIIAGLIGDIALRKNTPERNTDK